MHPKFVALALIAGLGSLLAQSTEEPSGETAIQVLVLGTFHMGADPDPLNPTVADLMADRRQEELDELVERLGKFKPTKVALEALSDAEVLASYRSFVAGELPAKADERQQVGFRLAHLVGHSEVHGIDHELWIDHQEILLWASQNGQGAIATKLMAAYQKTASAWTERFMHESSMTEIYRSFNSPDTEQALHDVFLSMVRIGSKEKPVGASTLARWYERNIHIAGNLLRLAEPGDRIVVIFGANHRKLLVEFLKRVPGVEVVDTLSYLGS